MSGIPLRIAFLWHNHQPYYEKDGEFILPWVRLHGVKDYFDLPLLLNEFPNIKQTFNFVPSLFLQITEYLNGKQDIIQRLTKIQASELTLDEKSQIIRLFFLCNEKNLIFPNQRFNELFQKSKHPNAIHYFSDQEWLDLQVWYNLTWLGEYSKTNPIVKRFFAKGKNFTEDEKNVLLEIHKDILSSIVPMLKKLKSLGQIDISTTPFYHPILPLLVDSNSAKEANPENPELEKPFAFPEDAEEQVKLAIECYENEFGHQPSGFWPSEGSISNDVLDLFISKNLRWTASDESVLNATYPPVNHLEKFFPRKYESNGKTITIFFRDHTLSDKIGFDYSNWSSHDAARDFVNALISIRQSIISNYGESALKHAVVPIILDGENCWEFYPHNGFEFLRALYSLISITPELKTILFDEILDDGSSDFLEKLKTIRAGSWIDANFNIWIGHNDDVEAWNMLNSARTLFQTKKSKFTKELSEQIYKEILIAEGSDWFWWYGPEHSAENKSDFDILFRWHIKNIYELMGETVPNEVFETIPKISSDYTKLPDSQIFPIVDGQIDKENKWEHSGFFVYNQSFSTMHQSAKPPIKLYFGNNDNTLFFRLDNFRKNIKETIVRLNLNDGKIIAQIDASGLSLKGNTDEIIDYNFAIGEITELSIPLSYIIFSETPKNNFKDEKVQISADFINIVENKTFSKLIDLTLF